MNVTLHFFPSGLGCFSMLGLLVLLNDRPLNPFYVNVYYTARMTTRCGRSHSRYLLDPLERNMPFEHMHFNSLTFTQKKLISYLFISLKLNRICQTIDIIIQMLFFN
ncbi:unnamed protein product [Cuscuta epithymum]|uniref:Secreted protein n=1 Tax=Cuscuta epithymum TaxID=186058 RepID=A0AAV0DYC4_9ASTE|nr:unnamed protein product [Cuscuta epithymum]